MKSLFRRLLLRRSWRRMSHRLDLLKAFSASSGERALELLLTLYILKTSAFLEIHSSLGL